jgi:hypothetical protein
VNNAWATIKALQSLKTVEEVAAMRGKTVADVRRGAPLNGSNGNGNGAGEAVRPAVMEGVTSGTTATEPIGTAGEASNGD